MLAEIELFRAAVQWDLAFCDPRLEHRFQQRFTRSLGLADKAHCALLLAVMLFGVVRMLLAGVHHSNMESLLAPCKSLSPVRSCTIAVEALWPCMQTDRQELWHRGLTPKQEQTNSCMASPYVVLLVRPWRPCMRYV